MSLLHRKPKPLQPEERTYRDDRLIIVVTEDTYAPAQYFNFVKARRIHVRVAATQNGQSSPCAILESARALRTDDDFKDFDEFWLFLDVDHWTNPSHVSNFIGVIKQARSERFRVAVSNPCFDVWLLLHHTEINSGTDLHSAKAVAKCIREKTGRFNKTKLAREDYTVEKAITAIRRAKKLTPDLNAFQPKSPGTQVWGVVQQALSSIPGVAEL